MASYNTVITNEGAALLASVIANQGTLTFSEMRFSTTDYDGVEATLTVGTFAGVFITAAASASVVDSTTIKVGAQFDNSGIVGDHPLYSIGIVGTDGNTTALIAVCTTTNPDIIRAALTGVSTYAFNVNLAVSSTSDITVTGTTAAVLYNTDIIDTLNSTDATKPLSANMGHVLGEEVNAIVNVYGAKNLLPNKLKSGTYGGGATFDKQPSGVVVVNGTYTITTPGTREYVLLSDSYTDTNIGWLQGLYDQQLRKGFSLTLSKGNIALGFILTTIKSDNSAKQSIQIGVSETSKTFTLDMTDVVAYNAVYFIDDTTVFNYNVAEPMLRISSIVDGTYAPYSETNLGLTNHKANRADLASLNLTGTKNTTGATITAGTYFYLNGQYCRATQDILNNADFMKNTNYVVTSLGGELQGKYIYETSVQFNAYADGVKTNQTLINDVMTQLQSWKASNPNRAYQFNFLFFGLNSCTPYDLYLRTAYSDMSFKGMGLTPTDFFLRLVIAKTSASESYRGVGTFTRTDESYEVATNDVALVINVYQIL